MIERSLKTSITLIDKIGQRDQIAWARFVKLYAPLVYSWCRNAGLRPEDVSDVGQDVFAAVHKNIKTFDRSQKKKGAFRSWLWGITRNKIQDQFRNNNGLAHAGGGTDNIEHIHRLPDEEEPETVEGLSPRQILLQSAFAMLKKEFNGTTWQCFWRMAVEGERAPVIGEQLGMTAKAVRQAKFRVTRKLRELLEDDYPELFLDDDE